MLSSTYFTVTLSPIHYRHSGTLENHDSIEYAYPEFEGFRRERCIYAKKQNLME